MDCNCILFYISDAPSAFQEWLADYPFSLSVDAGLTDSFPPLPKLVWVLHMMISLVVTFSWEIEVPDCENAGGEKALEWEVGAVKWWFSLGLSFLFFLPFSPVLPFSFCERRMRASWKRRQKRQKKESRRNPEKEKSNRRLLRFLLAFVQTGMKRGWQKETIKNKSKAALLFPLSFATILIAPAKRLLISEIWNQQALLWAVLFDSLISRQEESMESKWAESCHSLVGAFSCYSALFLSFSVRDLFMVLCTQCWENKVRKRNGQQLQRFFLFYLSLALCQVLCKSVDRFPSNADFLFQVRIIVILSLSRFHPPFSYSALVLVCLVAVSFPLAFLPCYRSCVRFLIWDPLCWRVRSLLGYLSASSSSPSLTLCLLVTCLWRTTSLSSSRFESCVSWLWLFPIVLIFLWLPGLLSFVRSM